MRIAHSLTPSDIKVLPSIVYQKRQKPYFWMSMASMATAAHRNTVRIGDTLVFDGRSFQCVGAKLEASETAVQIRFAEPTGWNELIVRLEAADIGLNEHISLLPADAGGQA